MVKTGLKAPQSRGKNKPTWGQCPLENSKNTPNLAKKNEIEGASCLRKQNQPLMEFLRKRVLPYWVCKSFLFWKFQTSKTTHVEEEGECEKFC